MNMNCARNRTETRRFDSRCTTFLSTRVLVAAMEAFVYLSLAGVQGGNQVLPQGPRRGTVVAASKSNHTLRFRQLPLRARGCPPQFCPSLSQEDISASTPA
jgi:hypothetical protein